MSNIQPIIQPIISPIMIGLAGSGINIPAGATFYANYEYQRYYIAGRGFVDFDTAHDFTRNSEKYTFSKTAQLVAAALNQLAFSYDPLTREALGVDLERSATNGCTDFYGGSDFNDTRGVELQSSTEPLFDSIFRSLVKVAPSDSSTGSFIERVLSYTGAEALAVYKCIVKNTGGFQGVQINSNGLALLDFNVVDGVVSNSRPIDSSGSIQMLGHKITPLPDDMYRIEVAVKREALDSFFSFRVYPYDNKNRNFGAVLDTEQAIGNDILISGFELIQGTNTLGGTFVISSGSTTTRAADILTSDAATFGEWFNPSEGAFEFQIGSLQSHTEVAQDYIVFYMGKSSESGVGALIDDSLNLYASGSVAGRIILRYGQTSGLDIAGVDLINDTIKVTYDNTQAEIFVNGVSKGVIPKDASVDTSAWDIFRFGNLPLLNTANARFKQFWYKDSAL